MAHAREPITTILSLVAVAAACFVVAKATWPVLLATFVVACFGLCLYKLAEKEVHAAASKAARRKNPMSPVNPINPINPIVNNSSVRLARTARS
jgi:hypothetical protein